MFIPVRPFLSSLLMGFCFAVFAPFGAAAEKVGVDDRQDLRKAAIPLLQTYCVGCHGPEKQKAKLRLDTLSGDLLKKKDEAATWKAVLEQLETGAMPPKEAPSRPKPEQVALLVRWLRTEMTAAGQKLDGPSDLAYPVRGNYVDHDKLFHEPSTAFPATPARIWRLSPYAYLALLDSLTGGPVKKYIKVKPDKEGKQGVTFSTRAVTPPYGLTTDPGFRDYAFRYKVSGAEAQQMAINAKTVLEAMLDGSPKKGRNGRPTELTVIAEASAAPSANQVRAAVTYLFQKVLPREPTADEMTQATEFLSNSIARFGNRAGLVHGLTPILMHPDVVFRSELGHGKPDEHGRVLLSPTELAVAIAYALTDDRPDATLLAAARGGKLATRDDVRREVARLLGDPAVPKPRIVRFFREYFDYDKAPEVFKDNQVVKDAGFRLPVPRSYISGVRTLVLDTDRLVEHVLAKDHDVLRELLTTDKSYVGAGKPTNDPDGSVQPATPTKSLDVAFFPDHRKFYNLTPAVSWTEMPLTLPPEQRMGILTQPSWLVAHSSNMENHAIHRGKWVRERLLGGSIPDVPVTVDAKLPDEPKETLRHRMRVTREAYCWKCHVSMDPLGLPFEMFDHFGRFRTTELGKPVDASGEIVASGDPKLDGKVGNALEMIRKLADSDHVHEVFVRHAFRYWMGRNETLDDAPTLQAAYKAYKESGGSMKALITSLLTSDSFLYRRR